MATVLVSGRSRIFKLHHDLLCCFLLCYYRLSTFLLKELLHELGFLLQLASAMYQPALDEKFVRSSGRCGHHLLAICRQFLQHAYLMLQSVTSFLELGHLFLTLGCLDFRFSVRRQFMLHLSSVRLFFTCQVRNQLICLRVHTKRHDPRNSGKYIDQDDEPLLGLPCGVKGKLVAFALFKRTGRGLRVRFPLARRRVSSAVTHGHMRGAWLVRPRCWGCTLPPRWSHLD
jgi:hypothetical protein